MPVTAYPKFDTISASDLTILNADGTETTYFYTLHQICIYSIWMTDKHIQIVPGIYNTSTEETSPLPFMWEWEKGLEYDGNTYDDIREAITSYGLQTTAESFVLFFNQKLWNNETVSAYFEAPE